MSERTQFAVTPTQAELDQLQRDLKFHPADPEHAETLSVGQVTDFNERGYVAPLDVLSAEQVRDYRAYFDRLLEQTMAAGGDSYSISSAHLKHGRVWDLLTHPQIVACVKDLLGPHVIGWGSHFFCKMPGDGKQVAWHQDASYWPLSPSQAVTVWLAIDDADTENACMRFIAGSHHSGHLTYRPADAADHSVLGQVIENPEQYGHIVNDELRAGQMSIHSDLLLHGSEANTSSRRRCGLTLRYAAANVRASMEWNQKGVHVAGTDTSGHWSNRPRPAED